MTSNELDTPFRKIQRRDVIDVSAELAPTHTSLNANIKCILGSISCNLRPLCITSYLAIHINYFSMYRYY